MKYLLLNDKLIFAVDFSMMVFLILVQFIIYPSLKYIDIKKLEHWHNSYKSRVLVIMGPIMVTQIASVIYSFSLATNAKEPLRLILIILC